MGLECLYASWKLNTFKVSESDLHDHSYYCDGRNRGILVLQNHIFNWRGIKTHWRLQGRVSVYFKSLLPKFHFSYGLFLLVVWWI